MNWFLVLHSGLVQRVEVVLLSVRTPIPYPLAASKSRPRLQRRSWETMGEQGGHTTCKPLTPRSLRSCVNTCGSDSVRHQPAESIFQSRVGKSARGEAALRDRMSRRGQVE